MFTLCHVRISFLPFIELTCQHTIQQKLNSNENSKILFTAGWKVEEFNQIVDRLQKAMITVINITRMFSDPVVDVVEVNTAGQLSSIRETVTNIIRDVSQHQCTPATHIFVMMIGSDQRDTKPCALLVQCIPYHSINQQQIRQLETNCVKEMVSHGMEVAG